MTSNGCRGLTHGANCVMVLMGVMKDEIGDKEAKRSTNKHKKTLLESKEQVVSDDVSHACLASVAGSLSVFFWVFTLLLWPRMQMSYGYPRSCSVS